MTTNTAFKKDYSEKKVGEIVAENYRKAEIFKKFDIDFCCGGARSLRQSCEDSGIELAKVVYELEEFDKIGEKPKYDVESWSLTELIDHILYNHHTYVEDSLPVISDYAHKVKYKHGEEKPYVVEIADHFIGLAKELTAHLYKEENILFPFIKDMEIAVKNEKGIQIPFGSVQNPISAMIHDHENAGDELKTIKQLTQDFIPPEDACTSHQVLYGLLKDFEEDLMMHIHLENNVLFPKALLLEKQLLSA